jgi:N-hydroxyarylamine O-acetyltransferase
MNCEKYLQRIGTDQTNVSANLENLKLLQKNHLLNVPFENLDIHWKRPISLSNEKFYQKIVEEKRGGFCYELNGLFYELLTELGFESRMVSARVSRNDGSFGAEFDHLAILTKIADEEFLVDVGFGDFAVEPLKFVLDIEQTDKNGIFLIRNFDDDYFEVVKNDGDNWQSEYIFKNIERNLSEFTEMCNFHQTSPESHFTRGKVCSILTENGRKTLTDNKFIETIKGEKTEIAVDLEEEFNRILHKEFNLIRSY